MPKVTLVQSFGVDPSVPGGYDFDRIHQAFIPGNNPYLL
jgi:hypothetical protein